MARIGLPALLGGAALYAGAAAAAYSYVSAGRPDAAAGGSSSGSDGGGGGPCAFDRLAASYDERIGTEERWMGTSLLRWWLLRQAKARGGAMAAAAVAAGPPPLGRRAPSPDPLSAPHLTLSPTQPAGPRRAMCSS
jgi:hypothetical protein